MHVFIALIFIYDVFAFALSQILKIVNLQSDVWYLYKDSSSLRSTEEAAFACLIPSRNSNLYFNNIGGNEVSKFARPASASTDPRCHLGARRKQVNCIEIHKFYL